MYSHATHSGKALVQAFVSEAEKQSHPWPFTVSDPLTGSLRPLHTTTYPCFHWQSFSLICGHPMGF